MKVYRSEENVSTRVDITDRLEYYEDSKTFVIDSINISIDAVERPSYVDIHFNYLDILNLYDTFRHEIENKEYYFTQLKGYPNDKINYILSQVRNIYLINENYLIERSYKRLYDGFVKGSEYEWMDIEDIKYYLSEIKKYFFYNEAYSSNKEKTLILHKIIYGNVADIAMNVYGDRDNNYDRNSLSSFINPKTQIQELASNFLITPNFLYAQSKIKLSDYVESKKINNLHFKSLNRLLKINFEKKSLIELKKFLMKNIKFTLFDPNDDLLRLRD